MHFDFDFWPLFLVLALAWLVPILTRQISVIRIPSVVVEILSGFIIGDHVLGILPEAEYLDFLSLSGFIFLMFLSGLEVDVNQVYASLPKRRITPGTLLTNPLLSGLAIYTGTLALGYASAWLLAFYIPIQNLWYFTLIISTSSVGIILPVLKERGEVNQRYGQLIVLAAAIADILSILLFTLTSSYLKKGLQFEILLILSLLLAFVIAYYAGRSLVKQRFFKRVLHQLSHASSQIKVRGTIVLILLFVILSQWIDAEIILGAFLAGLLMSFFSRKERSSLLMKLDAMGYGFFIPVFFIMVGAGIDLDAFLAFDQSFLFMGGLVLVLYAIKVIPVWGIWGRLMDFSSSSAAGLLLASRLSLIIAAAQIGLELGVITEATNTAFVIMAVLTCTLSPVFYNQLQPTQTYRSEKTVIVGGGGTGVLLAESLQMHSKPYVIIEQHEQKVKDLSANGLMAVHGNGSDTSVYEAINLQPVNPVVILTESDLKNRQIATILKNDLGHQNLIAVANRKQNIQQLRANGIQAVDIPNTLATAVENRLFMPQTYYSIFDSFSTYGIREVLVQNANVEGKRIDDLDFPDEGFMMMIKKSTGIHVPHPAEVLENGDVAVIFGSEQALQVLEDRLGEPGQAALPET